MYTAKPAVYIWHCGIKISQISPENLMQKQFAGNLVCFIQVKKIPPNHATMIDHSPGYLQRQKSKPSCPSGAAVVKCDRALV
jgi:hypothetical protein